MKPFVKSLTPQFALKYYRRLNSSREKKQNQTKTVEEVFTEIYTNNKWGGARGEFCSGSGTDDQQIASKYISMISNHASTLGFKGQSFVDLGCGDFRIGKQLLSLCSSYIGIDVVQPLIKRNQELFSNDSTEFRHLDIVRDELPDGNIAFIRQVLQHLSNQQIISVLEKLSKYKYVFITEHYPTDNDAIKVNLDKVHGADVRVHHNSGVYLAKAPFNLPTQSLSMVLEVQGKGLDQENDQGVIRTYLYKPRDQEHS